MANRLPDNPWVQLTVSHLTERLLASYAKTGGINHVDGKNLPSKTAIAGITHNLVRLLFPGFFDEKLLHSSSSVVKPARWWNRSCTTSRMRFARVWNTVLLPSCQRKTFAPLHTRSRWNSWKACQESAICCGPMRRRR